MAPIFLREFNFANGDFLCVLRLIFAIGETVYSSLELIFAIFWKPPSIRNYNIPVFLIIYLFIFFLILSTQYYKL